MGQSEEKTQRKRYRRAELEEEESNPWLDALKKDAERGASDGDEGNDAGQRCGRRGWSAICF